MKKLVNQRIQNNTKYQPNFHIRNPTWFLQIKIQLFAQQLKYDPKLTPVITCQHPPNSSQNPFLMYQAASLRYAISPLNILEQMYYVINMVQSFMSTFMSQNLTSADICILGATQSFGMPALVIFSSSPAPFAYFSLEAIFQIKIKFQILLKHKNKAKQMLVHKKYFVLFQYLLFIIHYHLLFIHFLFSNSIIDIYMLLNKIQEFTAISFSENSQNKAAQQTCFFNLNNLKKKIEKNEPINSVSDKKQLNLPRINRQKQADKEQSYHKMLTISAETLSQFRKKQQRSSLAVEVEGEKQNRAISNSINTLNNLSIIQKWKRRDKNYDIVLNDNPQTTKTIRNETLKNFQIKVKKTKIKMPLLAQLTKQQRYFEDRLVEIPQDLVNKIGLYEAGNIFKTANINQFIDTSKQIKPVTNTRFFNFNACTKNQLFLTNPKILNEFIDMSINQCQNMQGFSKRSKKQTEKDNNTRSKFDTIQQNSCSVSEASTKKSYWIVTIQNYELLKNDDYKSLKVANIEDWVDINFIFYHVIKYLKKIKISNLAFKFNREEFMEEIWFGKKVNFKKFQKLLNIKFQVKKKVSGSNHKSIENSTRLAYVNKIFTNKNEVIKEIIRIWKDRKYLYQRKRQKSKEKQIFKWIILRLLAKIKIKRSKKLKKKRAFALYESFIKRGGYYEVEIYIPSFSESQFLRNTTQYMDTFQNLYYHIWKQSSKKVILVLPAINENLLNIYKEKIKSSSNITIICPQSHPLFPKTLPLSACLLFSAHALSRIQSLIQQKNAIIVPGRYHGENSYYELTLSEYLNTPLHCSLKNNYNLAEIKELFSNYGLFTPVYKKIEENSKFDNLILEFAELLMENPKVNFWILKINGEFNGRGVATFNTKSSKKLKQLLNEVKEKDKIMKASRLQIKQQQQKRQQLIKYLEIHFKLKLKVNFENCIFRIEEYISNFLKIGGIIEENHEGFETYEIFYNITPQIIYQLRMQADEQNPDQIESSMVSYCQNYSIDFVNRVSTFVLSEDIPLFLKKAVQKIEKLLQEKQYQGYITVSVIRKKQTNQIYGLDIKPFISTNFSIYYFLQSHLMKCVTQQLETRGFQKKEKEKRISGMFEEQSNESLQKSCMQVTDGLSVKIIRQKLNFYLEEQDQEGFTCLFIPVILFTDVDEIIKAQLIEEIVRENWDKIDTRNMKQREKDETYKCIYMSLGLTLSLIVYGKLKEMKKMKKVAIQEIRKLSDKIANVKLYRGKHATRDVFQFGDVIRAITKIRT